jgi:hypothetical protein
MGWFDSIEPGKVKVEITETIESTTGQNRFGLTIQDEGEFITIRRGVQLEPLDAEEEDGDSDSSSNISKR